MSKQITDLNLLLAHFAGVATLIDYGRFFRSMTSLFSETEAYLGSSWVEPFFISRNFLQY